MRLKEIFVVLIAIFVIYVECSHDETKFGVQSLSNGSRIFGGEKLDKEDFEFTWLVAIVLRSPKTFLCAGSLISEKHVLSGKTYAMLILIVNCILTTADLMNLADNFEKFLIF